MEVLGVFLDYNICVWRRQSKTNQNMNFACLFSSKSASRQIHALLDGASDSALALDGHFSLITDYTFTTGGSRWGCGKIPMDFRLGTLHKTDPVDLSGSDEDEGDSTVLAHAGPLDQTEPELTPIDQDLALQVRNLRLRCSVKDCHRPRQLGQSQCLDCDNPTNTQLATPVTTQLDSPSAAQPAQPAQIVLSQTRSDFRYGRGHTDGGCRNIILKSSRGKKQTLLNDVAGWAFQLLCSHGDRFVAAASLGPNSSNNIGEFTAIIKIIEQAIIAQIDQLDIFTDSMLAVQYYEGTCSKDCPHLSQLFETIEKLAAATSIQYRLTWIKSHSGDPDNDNVDSMCTAAILANDMTPRYQHTKIPEFAAPNAFTAPRHSLHPEARYQTLAPYAPFIEDDITPRGVHDLSDDRGNILHICPFCDPNRPKPLSNRKALLFHLRSQHYDESRIISPDVLNHFGIDRCAECNWDL